VLTAGGLGAAGAFTCCVCSLSPRSGNAWVLKNAYLRRDKPGQYYLRVSIWLCVVFLAIGLIALAYIRVASEYLPGIDLFDTGKIVAITKATRWQNPCARSLDVVLDSGSAIQFCEVTAWGHSIGSSALGMGDRVMIQSRNTKYFRVVKGIEAASK
jgi:hypothetical protein